jgi:hypothetical protein
LAIPVVIPAPKGTPQEAVKGRGDPGSAVRLVIPNEHIIPFGRPDERELIAAAIVTEEEERIERHIQTAQLLIATQRDVFDEYPGSRPDNLHSVLGADAVRHPEKGPERVRERLSKPLFNECHSIFRGSRPELYAREFEQSFMPYGDTQRQV